MNQLTTSDEPHICRRCVECVPPDHLHYVLECGAVICEKCGKEEDLEAELSEKIRAWL